MRVADLLERIVAIEVKLETLRVQTEASRLPVFTHADVDTLRAAAGELAWSQVLSAQLSDIADRVERLMGGE